MFKGFIKKRSRKKSGYEPVKKSPLLSKQQGSATDSQIVFRDDHFSSSSLSPQIKPAEEQQVHSETEVSSFFRQGKGDLTSCRYELKYRISEGKAQAVKDFVQHYLSVDKYALMYPDRQYPISSLYLDSPSLDLCRETIVGKPNRFKLRIRAYSDVFQSPLFLEVKRRVNRVILKSRARVDRAELEEVLEGLADADLQRRSPKEQESLRQFLFYKEALCAQPTILVRYLREPFEGEGENRVRVTFDRQICYRQPQGLEVPLNGDGWQLAALPFVVLEIKFTDHYPLWLEEMVRSFRLNLSSMSKYVSSVTQSHQDLFWNYLEC